MSKAQEIIYLVRTHYENVVIDNDFEKAYGIHDKIFSAYTKAEILEALFIMHAIALENQ